MTNLDGKQINITITEEEINKRLNQIEALQCDDELRSFLIDTLRALVRLDEIIGMKNTTIARLKKIFNKKNEKQSNRDTSNGGKGSKSTGRGTGQGNNGVKEYPEAQTVQHFLPDNLKSGNKCPECLQGTLHRYESGIYIRIIGQQMLKAIKNEVEKTRCNTCGKIFEADFADKNSGKYDASAISVIALMHYMLSFPFYRLEKLQKIFYTPMPRSVQWQLMEQLANYLLPVWKSMIDYAKDADLFHTDDTGNKILSQLRNKTKKNHMKKERTKVHTTGILAIKDNIKCLLFFTGIAYSGENLDKLLTNRESTSPIAVMSDALNQNNTKWITDVIKYLCLAHGRRKFEDLDERFQKEVDYIQSEIGLIYMHDKYCKENDFSHKERLAYHQQHSEPVMSRLKLWCQQCFDEKKVEPNSTLGIGIKYLLSHWVGLTGFLRDEGAPIDNNVLESHLRVPVMNRKNWLWYGSEVGALVGDIILSVLKTCELSKVDGFKYLNFLQNNCELVKSNPKKYLPWNMDL